jgi:hypothetical protein
MIKLFKTRKNILKEIARLELERDKKEKEPVKSDPKTYGFDKWRKEQEVKIINDKIKLLNKFV